MSKESYEKFHAQVVTPIREAIDRMHNNLVELTEAADNAYVCEECGKRPDIATTISVMHNSLMAAIKYDTADWTRNNQCGDCGRKELNEFTLKLKKIEVE